MSIQCNKSEYSNVLDEFVAHLVWFKQAFDERNARPEVETYESFKKGLLEEAISKNIRIDVIEILFREMERRYPELISTPEQEEPAKPDSTEKPTTSSSEQPALPNTGKNQDEKKKPRRGNKRKKSKSLSSKSCSGRKKGQGNLTPENFPNAIRLRFCFGSDFGAGSICPCCNNKKLETTRSPNLIRFEGQSPIEAKILVVDRLRCRSCSQEFEVNLPHHLSRDVAICKASPTAAAMSLVLRYGLGLPDLRLEQLAQWCDVNFSNSRQWEIAKEAYEGLLPIHGAFEHFVANAQLREVDDCNVRIISEMVQIYHELWLAEEAGYSDSAVRTGVQMTVWVATHDNVVVRWFKAGRQHQGEREFELEGKRTASQPVIRATDAATKASAAKPFPDQNSKGFIQTGAAPSNAKLTSAQTAYCWEHLRQTFEKASPGFQREMEIWQRDLKQVFKNDAQTKDLDAKTRLAYHQENSAPIIEAMKTRAHHELATNPKAEPNGSYAKAIQYFLKNIKGFCLFCEVPGVPLTTSLAESAAKFTKRHHKNSLSFLTQQGADVGAFFMSLIATCLWIKEDPLQYLAAIIEWRAQINEANALKWFPHNYKTELVKVQENYAKNEGSLPYRLCKKRTKPPNESEKINEIQNTEQKTNGHLQKNQPAKMVLQNLN